MCRTRQRTFIANSNHSLRSACSISNASQVAVNTLQMNPEPLKSIILNGYSLQHILVRYHGMKRFIKQTTKKTPQWLTDLVITQEVHLKLRCLLVHFTWWFTDLHMQPPPPPPQKKNPKKHGNHVQPRGSESLPRKRASVFPKSTLIWSWQIPAGGKNSESGYFLTFGIWDCFLLWTLRIRVNRFTHNKWFTGQIKIDVFTQSQQRCHGDCGLGWEHAVQWPVWTWLYSFRRKRYLNNLLLLVS